ncbi:reverse transcriptase domain, reverse transcriptase zinc-binding domain protein, partial [Tanacetum coccineum]
VWKWQPTWIYVHVPTIMPNVEDILFWRDINGNLKEFSVSSVWDVIRPRKVELSWLRVVWYSQCIPLRAFLLWLIMLKKLKTQDLLRQWDVSHDSNLNLLHCPLCNTQPDSHEHLFFECGYSSQPWMYMRNFAYMDNIPPS